MHYCRIVSVIVFLGLVGCVNLQEQELKEIQDDWMGDVRAILQNAQVEPAGKLNMVFWYRGESDSSLASYGKYFYDQEGKEILLLGFSAQDDTVSVSFPRYNQIGELVEQKVFSYPNWHFATDLNGGSLAKLEWSGTLNFSYDGEGKLISTESSSPVKERQIFLVSHYNEKGALIAKEYFQNFKQIDWHAFEYGENERVVKETWTEINSAAVPYRSYFYRYDDKGLLAAKETGKTFEANGELQDVHQYFYDERGRLIEEIEYHPNWGWPIDTRKKYSYHQD